MLVAPKGDRVAKARYWSTQTRDAGVADEHSELGYNQRMSNGFRFPGQSAFSGRANETAKFGTYTRDAGSGLDYAMNLYYQSRVGAVYESGPVPGKRRAGGSGELEPVCVCAGGSGELFVLSGRLPDAGRRCGCPGPPGGGLGGSDG
jgi:hypothetical protein